MKLYMVPLAPNPTKVMLYIAERAQLGVEMGIEQVMVNTVKGQHREAEHMARTPFGTLPVLELDDGSFILESLTIMEYLEEYFPNQPLFGTSLDDRIRAKQLERIVDLKIFSNSANYVHATQSPLGLDPDPARAKQCLANMQSALNYLEDLLADGRPLLNGEHVSPADCNLEASLQFVRFIESDILGERENIRAWDERYRERPAAKAVLKW